VDLGQAKALWALMRRRCFCMQLFLHAHAIYSFSEIEGTMDTKILSFNRFIDPLMANLLKHLN